MRVKLRFRIGTAPRHPLFPRLPVVWAWEARGVCSALAGHLPELRRAALSGASARRAVFPLYHNRTQSLTDAERDELWELFEVPVLGLLLDRHGKVEGYECEAQEGLHLVHPVAISPADTVISTPCDCGRLGDRLVPPSRIEPQRESQLALEFASPAKRASA